VHDERVDVVENALRALITRQASYALPIVTWFSKDKSWDQMVKEQSERNDLSGLPQPKEADAAFMRSLEELSNKLKPMHARGLAADRFSDTSRIRGSIGFSGSNKIVAVVGITSGEKAGDTATMRFMFGSPTDPRLNDFFKQYEERIGGKYSVVDKAGKVVSEPMKTTAPKELQQETTHV
jgi:hypothetical protein